jgi:hypothetical protein
MATLTGSAPILLVSDVVASANYFRDKVGFAYDELYGEPPCFGILQRDLRHLMLAQAPAEAIRPHWQVVPQMWNVYFWVDDVDGMYAELRERGAIIDYELHLKPYGVREFGIQDLDGHDIAFGQIVR